MLPMRMRVGDRIRVSGGMLDGLARLFILDGNGEKKDGLLCVN